MTRCRNKRGYSTHSRAAGAAQRRTEATNSLITCYHCEDCDRWHIGHPPTQYISDDLYATFVSAIDGLTADEYSAKLWSEIPLED